MSRVILLIITILVSAIFAGSSARADEPADKPSFDKQIAPLLVSRCVRCHAGTKPKGKLDLTTRAGVLKGGVSGAALEPGKAAASLLMKKVQDREMPPSGKALTEAELSLLARWIDAGAEWTGAPLAVKDDERKAGPDWWAFQPIKKTATPSIKNNTAVRNPIDSFILAALESKQLHLSCEAERRTYLRRVSLDLIGLLPTPAEIDDFVNDGSSKAHEKVVDRLLASPHYGERWGRHWLDVARFAESSGYENNKPRLNAWHYRDWVIRSFNEDKPYPRFVLEQLAGDAVANGDPLVDAATGFLAAGPTDLNVTQIPEARMMQRLNDLDDMIAAVGGGFLGLTLNCARCHDHKFDPIPQREYYALQAILNGVYNDEREYRGGDYDKRRREADEARAKLGSLYAQMDRDEPAAGARGAKATRPPVSVIRNVDRFAPVNARFVRMTISATVKDDQPALDEFEVYSTGPSPRNLALSSAGARESASPEAGEAFKIKYLNDGRYGETSNWVSGSPGKGWVMIELPEAAMIDRVVWGRDRNGKQSSKLASVYEIEVSTGGEKWQTVAGSWDRLPPGTADAREESSERKAWLKQVGELETRLTALNSGPTMHAGAFRPAQPTRLLKAGSPALPEERVAPGAIAVLGGKLAIDEHTPEQKRRLALAAWISDEHNPLPDRVMVNRVWHYHFGQGIVRTPSDFGFSGERPSHPELLDWLVTEFRAHGKRLKPLHRLIVLSGTYRQATLPDAKALAVDTDNRLLWRFPPRRLEAEVIRDAMLQVSGSLDERMGGAGYSIWNFAPKGVVQYTPREKVGPETFRRMVYQFVPRIHQDQTFGPFDCPDTSLPAPRRTESTTALQALNLWNSPFVLDQCERWAQRLRKDAGSEPANQVDRAFALIYGRPPSPQEKEGAVQLVRRHGLAVLCRTLYNSNEFLYGP